MIDKNILLFDSTYFDVEEIYSIDGVEYLHDLLIIRSPILGFFSRFISKKMLYRIAARLDFLASYAIVTVRMITSLCQSIRTKTISTYPSSLGLLSCDLIISRSKSAEIFNSIDAWLILPYTRFKTDEIENKFLSVYSFLSCMDIIYSYILSLKAIGYSNRTNINRYIRRLYVSFEFFMVKRVLERLDIDTKLVFANHKDRWAILFDESHQTSKTLLQHGVESTNYKYPIKLKNITELYAFNAKSCELLKNTILDCSPAVKFLRPTIKLTSCSSSAKLLVLIVSPISPLKEREEYIVKKLQCNDIDIYIKPHYQNKDYSFYEYLAQDNRFNLIKEQIFPKVDLVVSYDSTLVLEYQMCGIDVLLYDNKTLEEIVDSIFNLRNEINKKECLN